MMEYSVPINLDNGFIRRQCPKCGRQFKWHHGPTDDRPDDAIDPVLYHCPYCGMTANSDEWWTSEQVAYVQEAAQAPAMQVIQEELEQAFRGLNSKQVKASFKPAAGPEPPSLPPEPSDMQGVQSPCHPWEPVKVSEDWNEALHCIVCGGRYSI